MKFGVILRGENFEVRADDKIQNWGFCTTRFVEATNAEEAEAAAVELVRNDESLKSMMIDEPSLTPKIYMEEIFKAKWWKRLGGKGYSFFDMSAE